MDFIPLKILSASCNIPYLDLPCLFHLSHVFLDNIIICWRLQLVRAACTLIVSMLLFPVCRCRFVFAAGLQPPLSMPYIPTCCCRTTKVPIETVKSGNQRCRSVVKRNTISRGKSKNNLGHLCRHDTVDSPQSNIISSSN